jgi:septal ring factor EnvC (AmiA/AmiB activator)
MKTFINVSIPAVLAISLVLLLSTGASNSFGQMMNQTNQTGGQNTTEQAQQQLEQANQQMQQAQQQKEQAQQQLEQTNQTQQQLEQTNQTQQQDPEMNEKLLNYTNAAILALNDDDTSTVQDSLVQIQNALINASGKQVIVVPAPAVSPDEEDSN